jgi:hypothetical protein
VIVLVVGATPVKVPGGGVATKGFRASWGIINVKLFIPLARISGIFGSDRVVGKWFLSL